MSGPLSEGDARVEGPPPLKRNYLTPKLVAIVLAIDAFVVVFAGLAAFGLRRLDPALAFGGGAAFFLVCIVLAGLAMRRHWVVWAGWVVQVALILSGIVVWPMYLLGAGSLVLWVWCLWRGAKADRAVPPSTSGAAA